MFNTTRSLFLMVCLAFAITASNGAYAKKTLFRTKMILLAPIGSC